MAKRSAASGDAKYNKQIALILQGGGALGSYQAGVYQALAEQGYEPNWVAGISIGAIGSAIIAGNAPQNRVAKLREFWEQVTSPSARWPNPPYDAWQDAMRRSAALSAIAFGQPGFFRPRIPGIAKTGTAVPSYYSTAALRSTLERLVDFDRINSGETRFSAGAVNVRNGNFIYFDSAREKIRPEHVMASGALPPGFPAIEIDGEFYWDGGLVSNTPLRYVLESLPRHSTLAFQVDVFSARGPIPKNLEAVAEREKDIRYSSRTRMSVETFRYTHNLRRSISKLIAKLPDSLKNEPEVAFLCRVACQTTMDIVELVYRPGTELGPSKDFEFLRATMERRWEQGLKDARATLAAAPWLEPAPPEIAVRTFDVTSGRKTTDGRLSHLSPAAVELMERALVTAS